MDDGITIFGGGILYAGYPLYQRLTAQERTADSISVPEKSYTEIKKKYPISFKGLLWEPTTFKPVIPYSFVGGESNISIPYASDYKDSLQKKEM